MKHTLLILIFLFLFSCTSSFDKTAWEIAEQSVTNSEELIRFLEHYKGQEDEEKYKAACFLIENMPNKYSLSGNERKRIYDIDIVKSDSLILSLEYSFRLKSESPYLKDYTFAPIPSFADLVMLALKYNQGYIDVDNFTYGVISDFGCTSLVIVSEEAFRDFATKLQNNKETMSQNYRIALDGKNRAGIEDRIARCASFLQKEGAGLQFIFNLYNEMNQNWDGWKPKFVNEKG